MIGELQGDFGDLDNKYLKQNISKYQWQISGSFRRTPQHCAKWVLSHPGRRYQMIRIRPSREVETLSFSIRRHNSGREQIGSSWVQIGGSRAQNLSRYVVRTPSDGVSGCPAGYTPCMDSK